MWHHILLSVTVLVVLGFFVGAVTQKATGAVKALGILVTLWLLLLAVGAVVIGVTGWHHPGFDVMGPGGPGFMRHHLDAPPPPGQTPAPAPEAPAAPGPTGQ